ncbi:hypothetical protein Q1695_011062 [Nippostrongylus brasiliensis]|nr:hypothetical protein Q1695_011062 [Nippostrongylus brasiliensis]
MGDVVKVTEELSHCRTRLEAGVQENRRNRDLIQGLTDQVQRFRERSANDSARLRATPALATSLPQLAIEMASSPYVDLIQPPLSPAYHRSRQSRNKSLSRLDHAATSSIAQSTSIDLRRAYSPRIRSSPRLHYSDEHLNLDDQQNIDELFARLRNELFKNNTLEEINDMLREENDAALAVNDNLRHDVIELTRALEHLEQGQRNDRERFRVENARYRTQAEQQHRQLIELWKAFTAVRELHASTANDLDKQLTEFTRCAAMMKKAIRHAEFKNSELRDKITKEKDEVLEEVMAKYEALSATQIETEKQLVEKTRLMQRLQDEYSRTKEKNEEMESAVARIYNMPELSSAVLRPRTRSESPAYLHTVHDAMRKIRSALSMKSAEVRDANYRVEQADVEMSRLKKQIDVFEKERKTQRENDKKREEETTERERKISEMEHDLRRLTDRLQTAEEEKAMKDSLFASLQGTLATAHRTHKEFIETLMTNHRDELASRDKMHEDDMEERLNEERSRLNRLQGELDRTKLEVETFRQQLRDLKAEHSAVLKSSDEKDLTVHTLEETVENLRKQMDTELARLDAKDQEITEQTLRCEELLVSQQQLRQELEESRSTEVALTSENKTLQEQILQLRLEIDRLSEKVESAAQQEEDLKLKLKESQQLSEQHEQNVNKLRSSVMMLQDKLDSDAEETRIVRQQLEHHQNLTKERGDECAQLLKQIEEVKRERDILLDDVSTMKSEIATANSRLAQAEHDAEKRQAEDDQKLTILEDFRVNLERATNDAKQKEAQIEDLKEQVKTLQSEIDHREESAKADRVRLEAEHALNQRHTEDEWKEKLRIAQEDTNHKEKLLKECESRLEQLTKLHEKLMEEEHTVIEENNELKEKLQDQASKHKKELEELVEQNNLDRDDWENERQQLEKSKNALMVDLRADLAKSEAELKETQSREFALRADLKDAQEEIKDLQQRIARESRTLEEQQVAQREREDSRERARLTFAAELEESQVKLVKSTAQLEESIRKRQLLEGDLAKMETALARKSESLKQLEQKVDEMSERIRADEEREQKYKDQLAVLEKENYNLNMSKDKSAARLAEEQKKIQELEQKLRELNKGFQSAQLKARSEKERITERDGRVQTLTNKIRELELQLAEKSAKTDVESEFVKKMEMDGKSLALELENQRRTNVDLSRQNDELRGACKALEDELNATRNALEKKTNVSKQAMTDLLNNYKDAERKSVEKSAECEQLRAQLQGVSAKLERLEKRRADLESRLDESEVKNADLMKKLHQFERSAKMALSVAGTSTLRGGQSIVDIPKAGSSSGYGDSHSMLRTTSSTHDLSFATTSERAVHFHDHDGDRALDISSSMEITLQFLKERIEQLEREKAALSSELASQREELQANTTKTREAVGNMQSLERRIQDLQRENDSLESRLAAQRQLYVSNEEAMRAKDLEHRGLKAKIMSAELHLREKDSKINQMMSQMEALRVELSQMAGERQKLTSVAKVAEHEVKSLEDAAHSFKMERDQLTAKLHDVGAELKNTQNRLTETNSELDHVRRLLDESRRLQQKEKEHVEKLLFEEKKWKQEAASAKKSSDSYHKSMYEERIKQLQQDQESILLRNDALLAEIERLRKDHRDSNQRVALLNQKLADADRSVQNSNQSKQALQQQIAVLQKSEEVWNKLEKEMREELVVLRKERLILTSELEEFKRKLVRADVEKKEVEGFRARLDREVASLKKHVEALEEEKTRTEMAIRNTMSERKAIDKSLAAMEKENTELYRNCAQLQSQIAQLERDAGTRNVTKMLKEQGELEGRIAKLLVEKRQLEMVIEQKEMNFTHKRKLLESQLSLLRDQLEAEKKRRLELQQRDVRAGAAAAPSTGTDRHFSRATDLRASRSKSIQRQKSPFRVHRTVSSEMYQRTVRYDASMSSVSTCSYLTNDTSTSIETTIL